jgi:hypothetical protein
MKRPALLMLLLLGGCSIFRSNAPPIPPEQDTAGHRACRAEAQRSPEVQQLAQRENPAYYALDNRINEDRRVAEARGYRACLRREGLAAPGGVEPERFRR